MLKSFSEFKFFQAFKIPVEEADSVRFLLEYENAQGKLVYLDDARLVDISLNGIGFETKERLSIGQDLRVSMHFRKIHLDFDIEVIRAFTGSVREESLLYGAEFAPEDVEEVKRFIEQYIYSFSPERLRECLVQMALADRYSTMAEGLDMFSLLISLFKDMTNFGENDDFIENILEEIVRVISAQRATVYLVNPEKNELEAYAALGVDKRLLKFDYRKGIPGAVFTSGVSLNIDVTQDQTAFNYEIDQLLGTKTRTVMCNPIFNREDKIIGVVEVVNKRSEERFSVDDEKIMKVIALVFSSVFHNYNPVAQESQIRKFSVPKDRKHILIGKSKFMLALRGTIVRLKDLDNPVLIHGEEGVGKALLAKIIHYEGKRGIQHYHEIFCGGDNADYLQSELFGESEKEGKLERCKGGTLVLREVHLLPLELQRRLFDVVHQAEVSQASQDQHHHLKNTIRMIATSTKNLERLMRDGKFNKDLFEYLNQAYIDVLPLRKRMEDLRDLVNHFLKVECSKQGFLLKSFAPSLIERFLEHDWPGNIQELKICVERAVLYNPKSHVISNVESLALPHMSGGSAVKMFEDIPYANDVTVNLKDRLALIERQMILEEIRRHNGNKSRAARDMGMSREALRKKLMLSQEILDLLEGNAPGTLPPELLDNDDSDQEAA